MFSEVGQKLPLELGRWLSGQECLLHKHETVSSNLRIPTTPLESWIWLRMPITPVLDMEIGGSLWYAGCQQFHRETWSQGNKAPCGRAGHLTLLTGVCT